MDREMGRGGFTVCIKPEINLFYRFAVTGIQSEFSPFYGRIKTHSI